MREYENLDSWAQEQADINEAFRGDVLDGRKEDRLDRMLDICEEITERNGTIKSPSMLVDTVNRCRRHGGVQLEIPVPFCCRDNRVRRLLADLIAESDILWISASENCVTLTADVLDIWSKFHYEY